MAVVGSASVQEHDTSPKALPDHPSASTGPFTLGSMDNHATADAINTAYEEAVHFRPNTFSVPQGSAGKAFISQLSRYLSCFGDAGPYESQAIKIAMVFQQLLYKNLTNLCPILLPSVCNSALITGTKVTCTIYFTSVVLFNISSNIHHRQATRQMPRYLRI